MIETTGKRLAAARYHSARAGMLAEQLIQRANSPLTEVLATQIAHESGKAAGHAFRAAELAYDMGMAHGRMRLSPSIASRGSWLESSLLAGEAMKRSAPDMATHISAEIQKAGIVSGSIDDFNRKMREQRDRRSVKVESGILTGAPEGAIVMGENSAGEEREIKIGDRFDETVVRFRLLMNLRSKP